MPSSDKDWQSVSFRASDQPTIAWIPKSKLDPASVRPALFPEVTPSVLAAREQGAQDLDVDALVEQARREGQAEGQAEAQRRFDAELADLRAQVKGTVDAFRRGLDRAELTADREALELAVMLAEHVLRQKLSVDFESLASALASGVEEVDGSEPLTILCATERLQPLMEQVSVLQARLGLAGLQLEPDGALSEGDFLLQRGDATVDMRLSRRLEHLEHLLKEAMGLESES
jgi:flagellar biosynthesis/type III secretory pathway protein FliH